MNRRQIKETRVDFIRYTSITKFNKKIWEKETIDPYIEEQNKGSLLTDDR